MLETTDALVSGTAEEGMEGMGLGIGVEGTTGRVSDVATTWRLRRGWS